MTSIKNIFFVDDDKLFVYLTRKTIEAANFGVQIKEFGDGEEAINYLKQIAADTELPDIILVDLNMPIMDGWEFLEEYALIKQGVRKKARIYLVSSSISPHDIERAKNISSVSAFLIKPLSKEKVIEILKNV